LQGKIITIQGNSQVEVKLGVKYGWGIALGKVPRGDYAAPAS